MLVITGRIKVVLVGNNTDLVSVGASGIGGGEGELERMGGAHRQIRIQLADACYFLLGLPHTLFILMGWHKPLSHDTIADTQRLAPIHPPRPIGPSAPAHDGALDGTAAPVRNPYPFVYKRNTLDRDRIIVPAGWDS